MAEVSDIAHNILVGLIISVRVPESEKTQRMTQYLCREESAQRVLLRDIKMGLHAAIIPTTTGSLFEPLTLSLAEYSLC